MISRLATDKTAEVPLMSLLIPLAGSTAEMVVIPGARERTSPFDEAWFDTEATMESEVFQSTMVVTSAVEPLSYVPSAMNIEIAPAGIVVEVGMTLILTRLASDTSTRADSFDASLLTFEAVSRAEIDAIPREFAVARPDWVTDTMFDAVDAQTTELVRSCVLPSL